MYCDKENVNILTSLLVAHGVCHAVVCPGSRNATIVHNLDQCPEVDCWAVTDERSAGFYALGIAQATLEPVVVCVTSGSALLNVLPAVAEAYYQHLSLIVISADRPAAWIDQLDGQTLRQPGALEPWVAKSVSLPEPSTDTERWHCNRLVNEALLEAISDRHCCVHINVPISEPMFTFTTLQLPCERVIRRYAPLVDYDCLCFALVDDLLTAERPLVVFGQMGRESFTYGAADYLFSHVIVLHESLADFPNVCHADEVLAVPHDDLLPDFILYVGDAIVSKHLKQFLRKAKDARVWRVNLSGDVEDTFQNLKGVVVGDAEFVLDSLSRKMANRHLDRSAAYRRKWLGLLKQASEKARNYHPAYSQMAAVCRFELLLSAVGYDFRVHYANSSSIRLANIYAAHHVCCNRGVNGIEGSLSAAAGYTLAVGASQPHCVVFCVIGDLSFFYDQNALWSLRAKLLSLKNGASLRILLLNNGRGGIFDRLPGLHDSKALDRFVAGSHTTSAEGICSQNGVSYRPAHDECQLDEGLRWLTSAVGDCLMLLEVFTDAEADSRAIADYLG